MAKSVILKDKDEIQLSPITSASTVITSDGDNVENKLRWMPIGTIFQAIRAASYPPQGCVRLDGAVLQRSNWEGFYALLGTVIPAENTSNPDLNAIPFTDNERGKIWYNNTHFRVPQLFSGEVVAQGDGGGYSKGGLPNITGSVEGMIGFTILANGAFNFTDTGAATSGGAGNRLGNFDIDASRSSSIYGASSSVIPAHIKYPYFMVISNTAPEASATEWNNFVGNLTNKANIDLMNTTANTDFVIESDYGLTGSNYTNGWYRKYKSGWIEQGGYTAGATTAILLTFPKPFLNPDWIINFQFVTAATDNTREVFGIKPIQNGIRTGSQFEFNTTYVGASAAAGVANVTIFAWEAKGMGV